MEKGNSFIGGILKKIFLTNYTKTIKHTRKGNFHNLIGQILKNWKKILFFLQYIFPLPAS